MLQDLTIQSHVILAEISPDSKAEKDGIADGIKELEVGEKQYSDMLDKFDASSAQIIEQIHGEVNRSEMMMPPPAALWH